LSQSLDLAEQGYLFANPEFALAYSVHNRRVFSELSVGGSLVSSSRPHAVGSSDAFQSWWRSFLRGRRSPQHPVAPPIRLLDLYSSVGGLTLGVSEAFAAMGFNTEIIAGVDVDADALASFSMNHQPDSVILESVANLVDMRVAGRGPGARFLYQPEVSGALARLSHVPDVLVAGPPCQGHSTLNNHTRGDDPKNRLYLTVPAIAVAMGVPVVIMENVPNVVNDKRGVVATTEQLLSSAGYHVTTTTLAAHKLGWAQTRKRFFLVGIKDDYPIELPWLKNELARNPASVTWAIGDLEDAVDPNDVMLGQPSLSKENQARIAYLFETDKYNLPLANRPECHRDGTTYTAVYGRMRADEPAPTITTGFVTPGRGRFIHPTRPRVLTPREAARIQGFPDWFRFVSANGGEPTRAMLAKWIGDAVPSILGYVAGLSTAPWVIKSRQVDVDVSGVIS